MRDLIQGKPHYLRVENEIRQKIVSGEYPVDSRIPSEAELCEEYGVSRITVRRAVQDLTDLGVLSKHRGLGTFVRAPHDIVTVCSDGTTTRITDPLTSCPEKMSQEVLSYDVVAADDRIASALGVDRGTDLHRIERIVLRDCFPMATDVTWVPCHVVNDFSSCSSNDAWLPAELTRLTGITDGCSEVCVYASVASSEDAKVLGCITGAPLLVIRTTQFDSDGSVWSYTEARVRGDSVSYRFLDGAPGALDIVF